MRATLSYILLWTTYLLATAEVKLLVNLVEARWGQTVSLAPVSYLVVWGFLFL